MKRVKGNILDAGHGIICHQVNCRMVMGSGLAKQIRTKWPHVYSEYMQLNTWPVERRFGLCQIVEIKSKELYVANLFGQLDYGREKGRVYTDTGALGNALNQLRGWHSENCHEDFPIWFPFKIGCGLAGGNWNEVQTLLESLLPKAFIVRREEDH